MLICVTPYSSVQNIQYIIYLTCEKVPQYPKRKQQKNKKQMKNFTLRRLKGTCNDYYSLFFII